MRNFHPNPIFEAINVSSDIIKDRCYAVECLVDAIDGKVLLVVPSALDEEL